MKSSLISLLIFLFVNLNVEAQENKNFTAEMAVKLTELPLHCINQEYPNKTGHSFESADDICFSPKDLHPSFYGCFDWHSSVHGHWMLLRVLRIFPDLSNKSEISRILDNSFQPENLQKEANYFSKYKLGKNFERTYGWAWLLKLDEELQNSKLPEAKEWHKNMKPLTDTIVKKWKAYLPKQTYPNRTGVHPNSAFALGFAIDWARRTNDTEFEKSLIDKALYFYANDTNTPAYLEPDGSDFFSPSLQIADLMSRIYETREFEEWFESFISDKGLENISKIPVVSDLSDYQTVHLVGLSFSRAWCMRNIANKLSENNPRKKSLMQTGVKLINNALPLLFEGNYGGEHWLASFALYAMDNNQ